MSASEHASASVPVRVGGRPVHGRSSLTVHETSVLSGLSENEVAAALRTQELETVWEGRRRCVAARDVALLTRLSPVATTVLRATLERRIRITRRDSHADLFDLHRKALAP